MLVGGRSSHNPRSMTERMLDDETRYRLLRLLSEDPSLSQRDLAAEIGVSVGKVNYCLKALLEKGYIKVSNFKNNRNKAAYLYQLTPAGISAKARAANSFLKRKQKEYEQLSEEIKLLQKEASEINRAKAK